MLVRGTIYNWHPTRSFTGNYSGTGGLWVAVGGGSHLRVVGGTATVRPPPERLSLKTGSRLREIMIKGSSVESGLETCLGV